MIYQLPSNYFFLVRYKKTDHFSSLFCNDMNIYILFEVESEFNTQKFKARSFFVGVTIHQDWCRFMVSGWWNVISIDLNVLNDTSQSCYSAVRIRRGVRTATRHWSSRCLEVHPYTVISCLVWFDQKTKTKIFCCHAFDKSQMRSSMEYCCCHIWVGASHPHRLSLKGSKMLMQPCW